MFSNQVQDPVYVIIIAHLCNLRDTLEELSKASRRVGSSVIGSKDREENCNGNQESWSRSEAVSLERTIKKEKDLEVKDDNWQIAVCPSGPSMDGRARLDGRLGKIARLKPVFL